MEIRRWHTFLHTLAFVLGFSLIFVLLLSRLGLVFDLLFQPVSWLGEGAARVLTWPGKPPLTYLALLQKVAAIFLLLFALHTMGLLRIGFFDLEKRMNVQVDRRWGYFSSLLVGITFAVGWTPCVTGPLSGILALGFESPGLMTWLLGMYSLGLGVPFLLMGIFLDRAVPFVQWMMRHRRPIAIISGLLLIVIALAIFFGRLRLLASIQPWI
jgi:cytochrome c-type biogenesis protein